MTLENRNQNNAAVFAVLYISAVLIAGGYMYYNMCLAGSEADSDPNWHWVCDGSGDTCVKVPDHNANYDAYTQRSFFGLVVFVGLVVVGLAYAMASS